jgi:hypothetical protein
MTTFKINREKEDDAAPSVAVYTFIGEQDRLDQQGFPILDLEYEDDVFEEPDAYAIKLVKGRKTNYYVKRGKYGKLFNPIGMYSEGRKNQQMRHAGRPEWRFEPTSEKIFTYYINFLKSKNAAWLNNAEREI